MVENVDVARAKQLIADGAQLIDVLPTSVYAQEHLPSAVNIPLATLKGSALDKFDRSKPTLLYCFDQH